MLLKLTFHGILTSFPTGTMVELDIVDTILSSFSDVLMSLLSVETLLRLVIIKLFVRELIRALVLLFLFTSSFIALKPRIVSCNAFLITTKGICKRWDSSSPWHVSQREISTQPANDISSWFSHCTLSLSHEPKISYILEALRSFKWVFNQEES